MPMVAGFGYTAFVIDAYAGLIPGWECSLSMQTVFVERALRHAAADVGGINYPPSARPMASAAACIDRRSRCP